MLTLSGKVDHWKHICLLPMIRFLKALRTAWQRYRVIHISDEYTTWLSYTNAGFLEPGNLYCFDFVMRNLPHDSPLLEIGTFCGFSANLITYYKALYGRPNLLITVDPWQFGDIGDRLRTQFPENQQISKAQVRQFVKESYQRNIMFFSDFDLPYTIEQPSDEFFNGWAEGNSVKDILGRSITLGGTISFAYIDGNHTYEQTYRDFLNCDRILVPGGFILFDDSADGSGWEVCDVVKQVLKHPNYDLIIKNPNYLFMKRR